MYTTASTGKHFIALIANQKYFFLFNHNHQNVTMFIDGQKKWKEDYNSSLMTLNSLETCQKGLL